MSRKVSDGAGSPKTHSLVPTSDPDAEHAPPSSKRSSKRRTRGSRMGSADAAQLAHDTAAARLHFAREQGRKRRAAICKPPILIGSVLFLPSGLFFCAAKVLPILGVAEFLLPYAWFGGCVGAVAVPTLMFALLPEDIWRIKFVAFMLVDVFLFAFVAAFGFVVLAVMALRDGCKDAFGMDEEVPCWYAAVSVVWPALFSFSYLAVAVLLLHKKKHEPPRKLLDSMWRVVGAWYFFLGFVVFPLAWVPRLAFESMNLDSTALALLCVELSILGHVLLHFKTLR